MNNIVARWIQPLLARALAVMPVVVITGARQVGKTTLARQLVPGPARRFLSLDDLDILDQARRDPMSLFAGRRPVTIDEVQRCPELLLALKRVVDNNRTPGMALLTGSANLALMHDVSESLAGRAYYLELAPFSPAEWRQDRSAPAALDALFEERFDETSWPDQDGNWLEWLLAGGFPSALRAAKGRDIWFAGYVQAYLERDLRMLSAVADLADFQRMMRLAAQRAARILNQSELARDAALPQPTCHRYLNLLETGYQIARLGPYSGGNPSVPLIKAKKLLWCDCGLAAYLAGINSPETLRRRPDHGFWFEQAVYQTLQAWAALDSGRRRIYYWRDRRRHEVDFILEQDDALVAVETKASLSGGLKDCGGIDAFTAALGARRKQLRHAVLLHAGTGARPLGENRFALGAGWMFAGRP